MDAVDALSCATLIFFSTLVYPVITFVNTCNTTLDREALLGDNDTTI